MATLRIMFPQKMSKETSEAQEITIVPQRTCVSCGRKTEKTELKRFVWGENSPLEDIPGTASGRGAYCCRNEKCVHSMKVQQKKWKRLFRL
ncbi:YlxR family protein [Desulfopila sp. IMCC35008]|uniref:YlxR family protein n=1 Tax=Desulfopila sp. IMCC35008 TaxID=2653858 RepID=UPI0035195164